MKLLPAREALMNAVVMLVLFVLVVFSRALSGAEILNVEFDGESSVAAGITLSPPDGQEPKMVVRDNLVTLTFDKTTLSKRFDGKLEISNPHFLVEKLAVYQPYEGMVRANFILNGSTTGLGDRVRLTRTRTGFKLAIDPPKGGQATLDLLKKENLPLVAGITPEKKLAISDPMPRWIAAIGLALLLGVVGLFVVKYMKRRLPFSGSRKYLIEQYGYSSLGPKTGIALYKVGREFVLLGVTPSQISFLSNLPKLQQQYEEESEFDRGSFKSAVREEMGRTSKPNLEA